MVMRKVLFTLELQQLRRFAAPLHFNARSFLICSLSRETRLSFSFYLDSVSILHSVSVLEANYKKALRNAHSLHNRTVLVLFFVF